MLHLVTGSPFTSQSLERSLYYMTATDCLLLCQDGVIAACIPKFADQLQQWGGRVYVLQEDVVARGLDPVYGEPVEMADFVRLVADQGSPLRW